MAATRVKICGITREEDALAVAASGADAIGLNFYAASPRAVSADRAAELAEVLPPFLSVVALFVDEPVSGIARILDTVPVDIIQFHGDETPEFCEQFGRPWIKALRVKPGLDIVDACRRFHRARGMLLDSWQAGVPGGTGKTFDWSLTPADLPLPTVLAGGLHAGNVGEAIAALHPAAVDVSGGVESAPGIKDAEKIHRFVAAVRAAEQQPDGVRYVD
ncbi:N-(5'-phosphoribosyl)anthranilate isomerase [Halioglobus japonicus]|nr:N-(5'-phosphoribosyl)anthranilate isomerase [Halioglobus japonicus]